MHDTSTAFPQPGHERRFPGRPLLLSLLCVLAILLALSIPDHHVHIDEAWIGEQSYFLARDGYVHSNLFEGFAGNSERTVVYHRLFVLAGSWTVNLFGWGIGSLRVVPVLSGLLLIGLMWLYMRREMKWDVQEILLAIGIFLLIPLDFLYLKIFRPEMMTAAFGFLSFYLITRSVREERLSIYYAMGAGVTSAAAALAHPYGLIYVVAGFILLLRSRRWKGASLFALFALLAALPYLYDIATHFELFREQISNPIVAEKTRFTVLTPITNLLDEHKRLFRKPEIILITLLFILSLFRNLKREFRERRIFYIYTFLLVLLLGMLAQDKVSRYAIFLLPFFTIEVAAACRHMLREPGGSRWLRWGFALLCALFLGYGLYFAATDAFISKEYVTEVNGRIERHLPPGSRVVAPMNFIFNGIERHTVIGLRMANMEQKNHLRAAEALSFAERHRADAIILNRYMTLDERIADYDTAGAILLEEFQVAARTNEYTVLRRDTAGN